MNKDKNGTPFEIGGMRNPLYKYDKDRISQYFSCDIPIHHQKDFDIMEEGILIMYNKKFGIFFNYTDIESAQEGYFFIELKTVDGIHRLSFYHQFTHTVLGIEIFQFTKYINKKIKGISCAIPDLFYKKVYFRKSYHSLKEALLEGSL